MNDAEADLEFALSNPNQLKKNINTGAGEGANASSKVNMMQFMRPDTLAELVWSPKTGLSIKFAEEKPGFKWEAAPTDMSSQNTQNQQHITSLATCHVSGKGSPNQGAADQLHNHLFEDEIMSGCDGSGSKSRPPLKVEHMMQCRPDTRVKRANVETDTVKTEHQIESHGRMESCRSANFLTEKRKCKFDQQLILGSKRIKNHADGSSFMNWILNTVKGYKNIHNGYDPRVGVYDVTSGFHNVFHSLFSPETIKQFDNKSIGSSTSKETVLTENGTLGYSKIKDKRVSLYERVTKESPKNMFDIIRKLRLSRTDILKWMNSQLKVVHNLDGFFLRVRVAKWEEEAGGSSYYVACITESQGETDSKQSVRVKVGDVECVVQSQHVSNCDFLEDELKVWWEKTLKTGEIQVVKDLKSKLAEKRTLGM